MTGFVPNLAKRGPHDALDLMTILGAPCPHCDPVIEAAIRAMPLEIHGLPEHMDWHEKMMRYRDELEACIIEMADRISALERDVAFRDAFIRQMKENAAKAAKSATVDEHLRRGLASHAAG